MDPIINRNDFSRCWCGAKYETLTPTPSERQSAEHQHPARCANGHFVYLTSREYDLVNGRR